MASWLELARIPISQQVRRVGSRLEAKITYRSFFLRVARRDPSMSDEGADGQDVPTVPPEAPEAPPDGSESPDGEEEEPTETTELVPRPVYPPSWCYATRQTIGLGALELALLMANASQLTALLALPDTKNSNFIALLVFLAISMVLLLATAGMVVYLGLVTPKSQAVFTRGTHVNIAAFCLILVIASTNVFITAFGVSYIDENR